MRFKQDGTLLENGRNGTMEVGNGASGRFLISNWLVYPVNLWLVYCGDDVAV